MSAMMEICEGRKNCKKAHTRVAAISKIDAKALPLRDVAELDFRKKPCMSVLGVRPHFIGVFRRKDAIQWSVVAKCLKSFSPSLRGLKPVVECLGMPKIFAMYGMGSSQHPFFCNAFSGQRLGLFLDRQTSEPCHRFTQKTNTIQAAMVKFLLRRWTHQKK